MFPFSQFKALSKMLSVINAKVDKIMTALDDLKAATQAVSDGANEAQAELQADSAKITDLTAKLLAASTASSAPAGTADADVEAIAAQLNSVAAGLPKKVQPVVDAAASAAGTAATAPATGA